MVKKNEPRLEIVVVRKKKRKKKEIEDKLVVYDNSFNRLTLHTLNNTELNILSYFFTLLKGKRLIKRLLFQWQK